MSKNHKQINCLECGVEFITNTSRQRWCSSSCRVKGQNKERSEYKKQWSLKNVDAVRKSQRKWLEKYPERRKQASSGYRKRNRVYYAQYTSLRARKRMQATPLWADKQELLDAYIEAEYQQLEVDHIIPLTHNKVCGLHVPENLQLLTRSENAQKGNKFEPFDEDVQAIIEENK